MKVIKSDTGFLYFEKMFKQLMNNESPLVIWQLSPDSGERQITDTRLNSFHMESGKLFFEIKSKGDVEDSLPLYCYAKDGPIIFKSNIQDVYETNISVNLPEEIKELEESDAAFIKGAFGFDISDVWKVKRLGPQKTMAQRSSRDQKLLNDEFALSLDEEDELFADKRESPRTRPSEEKWVKILTQDGQSTENFKLHDLSRGGMGIITFDENKFLKGSEVFVVGFNDFDLDDPLVGVVMSIRAVDENTKEFKLGIKFSEG